VKKALKHTIIAGTVIILIVAGILILCFLKFNIKQKENNLYRVFNKDNKYGYINDKGQVVIPLKFDYARNFSDGLAAVKIGDKEGFINEKGNIMFYCDVDNVNDFKEGMALIREETGDGYLNTKGEKVIKPVYNSAEDFSDGLALVIAENQNGDYSFIDKKGNIAIEPTGIIDYGFYDGLAIIHKNGLIGYMNKKGGEAFEPQFIYTKPFSEDLLMNARKTKGKTEYLCIGKNGKKIFDFSCEKWNAFSEGMCAFSNNGKWGFLNKKGIVGIKPIFDSVGDFHEGLAKVQIKVDDKGDDNSIKWGFIDKSGNMVIKPRFDFVHNFKGNLAFYLMREGDTIIECGYVDKKGEIVYKYDIDKIIVEPSHSDQIMGDNNGTGILQED